MGVEMYKILIIDDSLEHRKVVYDNVLSDMYELEYAMKGGQVFRIIEEKEVDIYIVDVVLSGYNCADRENNIRPMNVLDVLERIPRDKPIILLTAELETIVKDGRFTPIINEVYDKGYNVVNFMSWSDFRKEYELKNENDDNADSINSKICVDVLKRRKKNVVKDGTVYDFLVIAALGEELEPFIEKFPNDEIQREYDEEIVINKSVFRTKNNKDYKFIAVRQKEMGNVDAAATLSRVLTKYSVRHVFMIGVCGGRDGKVKIGDIIMPREVIAYQNGKITDKGFQLNVSIAHSRGNVHESVYSQSDVILAEIFSEFLKPKIDAGRNIGVTRPIIIYEPMLSGSVVIDKYGMLDSIAEDVRKPKACAVDMESYAVYRIAKILNINATVIKSVMDLSSNKSDDYKEYAAYVSANYLYKIIYNEVVGL
jgi:nucleoside phosphorylase/CheY-like chemotaxis protein